MQTWIDRLADALGEEPLRPDEETRILAASREIAHRVERKTTPLAAFLIGSAVGRATAGGAERGDAFEAALSDTERLLPDAPTEGSSTGTG